MLVEDSPGATITFIRATDNTGDGIRFDNSDNGIISRGKLDGNSASIHMMGDSDGYFIDNNYLSNPAADNITVRGTSDDGEIYFNSTYGGAGVHIWDSTGTQVTDNSFYIGDNTNFSGAILATTGILGTTLDYNNYYDPGAGHIGDISGTTYDTIDTWRGALGGCPNSGNECAYWGTATSVVSDPEYSSPATGELSISPTSPLINLGMDVGIATDIKEDPRPYDGGYDIGADEREADEPGVPEFTIFTLILALGAGLVVIYLINKSHKTSLST